jgi:hypothetical protein
MKVYYFIHLLVMDRQMWKVKLNNTRDMWTWEEYSILMKWWMRTTALIVMSFTIIYKSFIRTIRYELCASHVKITKTNKLYTKSLLYITENRRKIDSHVMIIFYIKLNSKLEILLKRKDITSFALVDENVI